MEGKYTLFKTSEGIFTVPILAEKNIFKMKLDGHELSFRASIERYFIYYLYFYNRKGEIIKWLREIGRYDWSPAKFDRFIDKFIKMHPKTEFMEGFSLDKVPMQADEHYGLDLPIPFYCCTLSAQGERELMQILIDSPRQEIKSKMISWFSAYCRNYGYDFSRRCKGQEYELLYRSFLEQHCLDKYEPKPRTLEEINAIRERRKKDNRLALFVGAVIIAIVAIPVISFIILLCVDPDAKPRLNEICGEIFFYSLIVLGFLWAMFQSKFK